MTLDALVPLLRCPSCSGALAWEPVRQSPPLAEACGLLRCGCSAYPVLDGVPILRRGRLDFRSIANDRTIGTGPTIPEVAEAIEAGRGRRMLVDLLSFPVCPWPLNRLGAARRWAQRGVHEAAGRAWRRRHIGRMLDRQAALTAEDWMAAFYWHAPAPFDPFNYFFFRFGQPRYLVTVGLLTALPPLDGPLLDVACGFGHLLHPVTAGRARAAVGLDQNFHQAWVGRRYVAPGAAFVCADANRPLPVRDGALGGALVADVFHYLRDKADRVRDLRRCVGDGPVVLASVSNRLMDPDEGWPLTPAEYVGLFDGTCVRVQTQAGLLARYRAGLGPDLSASVASSEADRAKWLYLVAGGADEVFGDHGPFATWPHAAGSIGVNPLYARDGDRLRLRIPSPWYASENRELLETLPASVSLAEADAGDLLARGVLLGLPERYARSRGRPWTQRANRVVGALADRLGAGG